jgi:hypothetical protein
MRLSVVCLDPFGDDWGWGSAKMAGRRTHMSLFAMFKSTGPTGFGYGSTAEQVTEGLSLAGQTILVTGLLEQLKVQGQ